MRFVVHQQFVAVDPHVVLALYTDPAFYDELQGLPKIGQPELRGRVVDGDVVTLRVHYRFTAPLPSAALAVIDPDKLTWIEETTYDLAAATSRSRLLPDHYPDRLTASATARFVADPGGRGARREITGEVKVRMPLVGGKVERAIVSGLEEHLQDEARVANRLLHG